MHEAFNQIVSGVEHEGVALFEFAKQTEFFQTQQIGAGCLIDNAMQRLMLGKP
jgi:hypothetical protein